MAAHTPRQLADAADPAFAEALSSGRLAVHQAPRARPPAPAAAFVPPDPPLSLEGWDQWLADMEAAGRTGQVGHAEERAAVSAVPEIEALRETADLLVRESGLLVRRMAVLASRAADVRARLVAIEERERERSTARRAEAGQPGNDDDDDANPPVRRRLATGGGNAALCEVGPA